MDLTEEIRKCVEERLAPGQFVVDILISSKKGPKKILIIVDGDQGITIDDCAEISRHLSKTLDETNWIEENYMLEVSTPGLDHPLKLKRQYHKNIGRSLKVKLQDKVVEGKLTEVSDDKIILMQEIGQGKKKEINTIEVPFSTIENAFVLVSFK